MNPNDLQKDFLSQLQNQAGFHLFNQLLDVCLFVKDTSFRFMWVNNACIELLGCKTEVEIIGQTDITFSHRHLCEQYAVDDNYVISTGKSVVDKVELVRRQNGSLAWYNTTKIPMYAHDGTIIGIAGITRDLKQMSESSERFLGMAPVIETIWTQYQRNLTMGDLAGMMQLSVSQFERQFKKRFGITPLKYLIQIRVNAACDLLSRTNLPITKIASETGFYDQSHFTHCFVRTKGITPTDYRVQQQNSAN